MEIDKRIFISGFLITLLIFTTVIFLNTGMVDKRESVVVDKMNTLVKEYEDMQAIMFMSDFFGEEATCIALESMLVEMNKGLWELGSKIDLYRQAREEFMNDPFYIEQKEEFNRKEVLYFSMLKNMKDMCEIDQTIVSFFYRKKDFCDDCDSQAFVLSDIKHDLKNLEKDDKLAIFSFDTDIDVPAIRLLVRYYNITEYPCMVIGEKKYCGLFDKKDTTKIICKQSELPICG